MEQESACVAAPVQAVVRRHYCGACGIGYDTSCHTCSREPWWTVRDDRFEERALGDVVDLMHEDH